MKDQIGQRMKEQYEQRTRYFLPRRTYTIIRLDGKAFHTFTRGMDRPYDKDLMNLMDFTSQYLLENIQGAQFAYVQSDEISILLTDFDKTTTQAWFNGNIQKITSVSASLATMRFNQLLSDLQDDDRFKGKSALFDSRVFTIPDRTEVENYFIWRQQDAVRNSIQMLAQSLYSHKELHGKNQSQLQDMIHEKGDNWNNKTIREKRGGLFVANTFSKIYCPIFTKEREVFEELIPTYE